MQPSANAADKAPVPPDQEKSNPYAKKKVVLLTAYNGIKYSGLQKNPDVSTIEETTSRPPH